MGLEPLQVENVFLRKLCALVSQKQKNSHKEVQKILVWFLYIESNIAYQITLHS